ncbi:hypothetical protein K439DRAFT_1627925 [Ramaria rubella]|nr:hypothetical protein K439DRAFT_1627925 [Ramaria rubella]
MRTNLKLCGVRLKDLCVTPGSVKFVDILPLCPELERLIWSGGWQRLIELLRRTSGWHSKLNKIEITGTLFNLYKKNKDSVALLKRFFLALSSSLTAGRLPVLREIHFSQYNWPIEEREIVKDMVVKEAIQVKKTYSVDFTDSSGSPWRIRAERRR